MDADGLGCSFGNTIGVSVPCSGRGDRFCYSSDVLVLKFSTNYSTVVVSLGAYSKKGVMSLVLRRILMRSRIASVALSCGDRAGIATLIRNNWKV